MAERITPSMLMPETVIEQIRELHAAGGRTLSKAETIDFITRRVNMGTPEPVQPKALGRKPTRTQYDDATKRRRGLYHRLVRLPKISTAAGRASGDAKLKPREKIQALALRLAPLFKPRQLAAAIYRTAESERRPCDQSTPSIETIRRVLRKQRTK